MLYGSYGANTNLSKMTERCPDSVCLGKATLSGYMLVFRSVADIVEHEDSNIEVVVWKITKDWKEALDFYEGYPHLYDKIYLDIVVNDTLERVMFYQMTDRHLGYRYPSAYYLSVIEEGYKYNQLDLGQIYTAKGFVNPSELEET